MFVYLNVWRKEASTCDFCTYPICTEKPPLNVLAVVYRETIDLMIGLNLPILPYFT